MLASDAYAQYNRNKILTASPAELTLMLYEGCIKFINMAIKAVDEKDVQRANINIQKAEKIIDEFRQTLDFKYPVAKDFDVVYEYVGRRLVEANMTKEKAVLEECATHMRTMRDAWKEVMKAAPHPEAAGNRRQA